MVSAIKKSNLWAKLKAQGPCPKHESPIMQFRSDWYADEGGYNTTTKQRLTSAFYFEMDGTFIPLDILQVTVPPSLKKYVRRRSKPITTPVVIKIYNPLNVPFNDVKLVLHYEGGSGKPMPHYERIPIFLKAGEQQIKKVPAKIQKTYKNKNKANWIFHSATLKGKAAHCQFWPDLSQSDLP